MKQKMMLANRQIKDAVEILTGYIGAKVAGVDKNLRYWIGWNNDHFKSAARHYERERQVLVDLYGDIVAVRPEKMDSFLAHVFGGDLKSLIEKKSDYDEAFVQYRREGILGGETFAAFEERFPQLKKKIDSWFEKNPKGKQNEIIKPSCLTKYKEDLEDLYDKTEEVEVMILPLPEDDETANNEEFGVLISGITFMWEEPAAAPAKPAEEKPEKKKK